MRRRCLLPPIEVDQSNRLIDGRHRLIAHEKAGADTIRAIVTDVEDDVEFLELAIQRNAAHGHQLSLADKKAMARRIYHETAVEDRGGKKARLAGLLSVSERTIANWLSRIDKDDKEARDVAIANLWLECKSQAEIAERVGMSQRAVGQVLEQIETFRFVLKLDQRSEIEDAEERLEVIEAENVAMASHVFDFSIPLYNVWKLQDKTNVVSHFGNSEATWVDNLLYLYTNPFDVVLDPFAGGGSTLDVCKKRLRRCLLSDRKPIPERRGEIIEHDVADGPLKPPQWKDVSLVYLDPPYWKQAEGQYSDDDEDLVN